jgi:hypothetical protein
MMTKRVEMGRVTARTEYITGCVQVLVQPATKSDGTWSESQWIDESRLNYVGTGKVTIKMAATGSDRPAPKR